MPPFKNKDTTLSLLSEIRGAFQVELYDRFDATKHGISGDWTRYYNDRLDRGDYLVVVTGAEADIRQAEMALNPHRIRNWETYTPSGANHRHSNHSMDDSNRR